VADARNLRRAPKRERRSHAERTAETRAKILAAVVDAIAEVGFHRTTAVEITRRAGVTWGAVQHHFGDKDGILVAVLEDSFGRFAARLEDVPVERLALDRRVALFVGRAWQHFTSREYASTYEILLDHLRREDPPQPSGVRWQIQMSRAWERVWRRFFGDVAVPRKRQLRLQHYTVAVLTGLASTRMLEGGEPSLPREELALLEETLVRELRQGG
jgi:AcrR family transcriptional regulator